MGRRRPSTEGTLPLTGPDGAPFGSPFAVPEEKLDGKRVPQADEPDRILQLVERINQHLPIDAEGLGIAPRQVDYYTQAAQILGLVSSKNRLQAAGRALLTLDDRARRARLALAFENSGCGRAWAKWYGAPSLVEVQPKSAQNFILDAVDLHGETIGRRASTLKKWMRAWMPFHPAVNPEAGVALGTRKPKALGHIAVLDSGRSRQVVQALGPGTALLRCATAYLSVGGYELLVEPLSGAELRLLVGSESTFKSVEQILERFRESITTGPPTPAKQNAIRELHRSVVTGSVKVHLFDPRYKPQLHAKVYLFDEHAVYVTSANLSKGGLQSNIECGYVVHERNAIEYYRKRFDDLFQRATELTQEVLRELEESWAFEPLTTPYLLYLRVLAELFPKVPHLSNETHRRLADYQELIVGAVLQALRELRGALLVSPTGTGKTVMACYVAKVLSQQQNVQRIIVVCPNPRLRRTWEDEFHRFGLHPKVVTHGIVQGKGEPAEGKDERLRRLLSDARETDLVIVDECHAFRNQETNGFGTLHQFVGRREASHTPRLLLLSATPMSKSLEDLNALLELVSEAPLQEIDDIVKSRRVVNVTLPFIIQHFGTDKRGKHGTGLRFGKELRHFGRIQVRTLLYPSPAQQAFEYISKMSFRFRRAPTAAEQRRIEGEDTPSTGDMAASAGFLRLTLMRRAESSPRALQRTLEYLLSVYEDLLVPEDREAFNASLHELLRLAEPTPEDTKLAELVRALRERAAGQRVLVFSQWTDTVEYLKEALSKALPQERIESLTGRLTTKERGKLIRRFAPSAQGRSRRARSDDIDVLIATDAIAEGENLQDATIVVNYDLPWTPLSLIQRVGRVDRPTRQVRTIEVLNFYPGDDLFERQVRLWQSLGERSRMYDKMSRTQVVGEHDRDLSRVDEHDIGLVRDFDKGGSDFEQLRREYSRVPASTYLLDRAETLKRDISRANALPFGVRSCKRGPRAGIFALLRVGSGLRCIFWPADGSAAEESPVPLLHDELLRYVKATPETEQPEEPPSSKLELGSLVRQWAEKEKLEDDAVTVICAETIVPEVMDGSSPAAAPGTNLSDK